MKEPFGANGDECTSVVLKQFGGEKLRILAELQGIEKCSVVRRGHTTTITITSDMGLVHERGWEVRPLGPVKRASGKPSPR